LQAQANIFKINLFSIRRRHMADKHPISPACQPRRMVVTEIPPEGLELDLCATTEERYALAKLNELAKISALTGRLQLIRWKTNGAIVRGEVRARVTQICVRSLEEFETDVSSQIDLRLAPPTVEHVRGEERPLDHDAASLAALSEDPPDPLIDGVIDLWALVSEFLTLALDPYPHKPGVEFQDLSPTSDKTPSSSPFALLQELMSKKN
jgi:uncharacterized metal-binding protein YceD (DUF177 family)